MKCITEINVGSPPGAGYKDSIPGGGVERGQRPTPSNFFNKNYVPKVESCAIYEGCIRLL